MALRRRSLGSHHRPDWEQRLCRVDAELADAELSPDQPHERYPPKDRDRADDPERQLSLDMGDGTSPDSGEPPAAP